MRSNARLVCAKMASTCRDRDVSTALVLGMIQFRAARISLSRWVAGRVNKFVQQCLKKGGMDLIVTSHTHTLHTTTQPLNSTHIESADNTH